MIPRVASWLVAFTLAVCFVAPTVRGEAAAAPDEIEGLVAWYDAHAIHGRMRDDDRVQLWPDSSGNAHDLIDNGRGLPALFRTLQLGGKPAVDLDEKTTFDVTDPFTLEDHTIFVVYRTDRSERALFSSDESDYVGIVLRVAHESDQIRQGPDGFAYNAAPGNGADFVISVLSRRAGRMSSSIDGVDMSASQNSQVPLRVGRFFHIRLSRAVTRDAKGLSIAEMVFYDRELSFEEHRRVATYLAEKYELELAEAAPPPPPPPPDPEAPRFDWSKADVRVRLTAPGRDNLNDEAVALAWSSVAELAAPFVHAADQPTRISCEKASVRVRLKVHLDLVATVPGARVLVAVQKNFSEYLDDVAVSEPVADDPDGNKLTVDLETSTTLEPGDFLEIVTAREGEPAAVVTAAATSTLQIAVE